MYDWHGGVNFSATPDTVDAHELLASTNVRVEPSGAASRRAGVSKTHTVALGGAVRGLTSWQPAAGLTQYVAIANGKLNYSNDDCVTWTAVNVPSGALSLLHLADFATMTVSGTAYLIIASAGDVFSWDNASLVRHDGTTSLPDASVVRVYNDRLWANNLVAGAGDGILYASKLDSGFVFTIGGLSDGLAASLSAATKEPIIGMETLGTALLIATSTGVKRLTGTSDDIDIDTDSAGVTDDLGPIGDSSGGAMNAHPLTFKRVDQVVMMWTDRGPYAVTEAGVTALTEKLQLQGQGGGNVQWKTTAPAYIAHNTRRNEVWFIYSSTTDSATNAKTALIWNYAMQAWMGPFTFGCVVTSCCTGPAGTVLAGCSDGFVRNLDDITASRDDGADNYTHTFVLAPFTLNAGPITTKALRSVFVEMERSDPGNVPTVQVSADGAVPVTGILVNQAGAATTPTHLRFDIPALQGKRFFVSISGTFATALSGDNWKILGVICDGSVMDRW